MRALRDTALAADVLDTLCHDDRTRGLEVEVAVRGAVAHLSGCVPGEAERWLVRRLAGRVRGILAVWDLLVSGGRPPRVVDLGCGGVKQVPGSLGVDRWPAPGVDLVADLEGPLPLATASVDRVFAVHVLEHLHGLLPMLAEVHRVLVPGGLLYSLTPYWRHDNTWADPTHLRGFSPQTFKYLCEPHTGASLWRPHEVAVDADTVFATLEPVKDGHGPADAATLARFFD